MSHNYAPAVRVPLACGPFVLASRRGLGDDAICFQGARPMNEIRELIAFYDERGWNWSVVVAYVSMRQQFGSWKELSDSIRRPWPKERK